MDRPRRIAQRYDEIPELRSRFRLVVRTSKRDSDCRFPADFDLPFASSINDVAMDNAYEIQTNASAEILKSANIWMSGDAGCAGETGHDCGKMKKTSCTEAIFTLALMPNVR